jgi:hypothetical protein
LALFGRNSALFDHNWAQNGRHCATAGVTYFRDNLLSRRDFRPIHHPFPLLGCVTSPATPPARGSPPVGGASSPGYNQWKHFQVAKEHVYRFSLYRNPPATRLPPPGLPVTSGRPGFPPSPAPGWQKDGRQKKRNQPYGVCTGFLPSGPAAQGAETGGPERPKRLPDSSARDYLGVGRNLADSIRRRLVATAPCPRHDLNIGKQFPHHHRRRPRPAACPYFTEPGDTPFALLNYVGRCARTQFTIHGFVRRS